MESVRACTIRGQLELVVNDSPIDLAEVEPAKEIVKRFATGEISRFLSFITSPFQSHFNRQHFNQRCGIHQILIFIAIN